MGLFEYCICGHTQEDHAMDAPEGERECLAEGCDCENFEWDGGAGDLDRKIKGEVAKYKVGFPSIYTP